MKLSLLQLAHFLPGVVYLARAIHPRWFFRWSLYSAALASYVYPHARRQAQPFLKIFADRFDPVELKQRSRSHLRYRRLCNEIVGAWKNWEHRYEDWVSIEGEEYLKQALAKGRGAFLVSGHNYGYSRLIAPVLSMRGYQLHRGGNGKNPPEREGRWGKNYVRRWRYFYYQDGDYWHRVRLLKTVREALGQNDVIHISPLNYRTGTPEMEVAFWRGKFFLDHKWFRLMEICQAPALPCFAVGAANGMIKIEIHAPLPAGREAMALGFGEVFLSYLKDRPEYARFWSAILKERPWW